MVLDVSAKTKDGKEVYKKQVIYMPYPGRMGRGEEMGRGPYEKSGLLKETSLAPMKTTKASFEIPFPYKDITDKAGKKTRELSADELDVSIKLWYVPFGEFDGHEVLYFEENRKLELKGEWVWKS